MSKGNPAKSAPVQIGLVQQLLIGTAQHKTQPTLMLGLHKVSGGAGSCQRLGNLPENVGWGSQPSALDGEGQTIESDLAQLLQMAFGQQAAAVGLYRIGPKLV